MLDPELRKVLEEHSNPNALVVRLAPAAVHGADPARVVAALAEQVLGQGVPFEVIGLPAQVSGRRGGRKAWASPAVQAAFARSSLSLWVVVMAEDDKVIGRLSQEFGELELIAQVYRPPVNWREGEVEYPPEQEAD